MPMKALFSLEGLAKIMVESFITQTIYIKDLLLEAKVHAKRYVASSVMYLLYGEIVA